MPKIVDHDQRRRELAAAMWRVLYRDGIDGVTVRSVAEEAGLSKATLAHYFAGQNDLLLFAMSESIDKTATQLRGSKLESADFNQFVAAVCQIVPTTPARRMQSEIWLGVVARSQSDPELRASLAEINANVRDGIAELLTLMLGRGYISAERNIAGEAQQLHALIDGLTLHTLTDPSAVSGTAIKEIIRHHLSDLSLD